MGTGFSATGDDVGVKGFSDPGKGVLGVSGTDTGVLGTSTPGTGVAGISESGTGVLARSDRGIAIRIEGDIQIGGNAIGFPFGRFLITTTGVASITVPNPLVTPKSIVLLTPLSDPGGPVWVTGVTTGSFDVNRSGTLPSFNFVYLVIN